MELKKILRKAIKLGHLIAVTIPADFLENTSYVWVSREDNRIVIMPARVE